MARPSAIRLIPTLAPSANSTRSSRRRSTPSGSASRLITEVNSEVKPVRKAASLRMSSRSMVPQRRCTSALSASRLCACRARTSSNSPRHRCWSHRNTDNPNSLLIIDRSPPEITQAKIETLGVHGDSTQRDLGTSQRKRCCLQRLDRRRPSP
jgi:hypothetical protein